MANKYRKNIKYYINWKFYREGDKVWEARTDKELDEFKEDKLFEAWSDYESDRYEDYNDGDWWELYMEEIADAAYYCDGYKARNTEEAYFLITEVIGIDEANDWLAERVY